MSNESRFALDHIVVACCSLDSGAAWLEDRMGVPLSPGGSHPGWGTHNRLLRLADDVYLELIAPDPEQPQVPRPRLFGLDDPVLRQSLARRPRLIHYVVRTPDLDAARAALAYDPGVIQSMSRATLRWRITVPADGVRQQAGVLPTLIQWESSVHPCERLPDRGLSLTRLEVCAPAAVLAQLPPLARAGRVSLTPGEAPGLRLTVQCAAGAAMLD